MNFLDGTTSLGSATVTAGVAHFSVPLLSAGSHSITAVYFGDINFNTVTGSALAETVNKLTPLTSSANPALAQATLTLTAAVSSSIGTPTGSVSFLDGTTILGSGAITAGVANLVVPALRVGSHSLTTVYSGDVSFNSVASSVLTETVDYNLSFQSTTLTVEPNSTATYIFTVSPVNSPVLPAAVTFSVTGLPAGATYSFTPPSLAAGAGSTSVTLSIQIPQAAARLEPTHNLSRLAPVTLALLLVPFATFRRRKLTRLHRLSVLLVWIAAGIAATTALSGCGTSNGYFGQPQQTYNVTVTGTSGPVSHTSTVTLIVE